MDKREPDTGGDYGYDLVHEAVAAARPPERGSGPEEADRAARDDRDGDYGYDEAHDF
jgi:hypothetical protein